ncbi:TetR/AcrR family transcriptional regulator [Paraburkholderia atlantica]|uniref:TetR/AcrR family transcriptional regulator n=1 Tax=Paraburkholderia atlantica TaxID=2654982 RepID=UPI0016122F6A|nr:TetR/AcrR family transcriptional regulator [Paraburkholderia atlantica]MBB5510135.1 AcrR family transcriptional regulator [Paraburkholderia atlantica]
MENAQQIGNRRGQRSRQEILDAAARVMSAYGYTGTSMSALVEATGIPKSAIYHHFGSKAGLLVEVMAQGARGFFAAMREAHQNPPEGGTSRERLGWYLKKTGEVFQHRENFLRLLVVMVMSNEAAEPEAIQTVIEVRNEGRDYMREMIRSTFRAEGDAVASAVADELAYFGMLGFDGAFVSFQSGDNRSMETHMAQLTDALIALGEARAASFREETQAAARKREAKPAKDSVRPAPKRPKSKAVQKGGIAG